MKELDRRTRLWIELAIVSLWLIAPSLLSQLVVYSTHSVPVSRELQRFVSTITQVGGIAALLLVLWSSGDSLASFGIVKEKAGRFLLVTVILFAISFAITKTLDTKHTIAVVTAEGLQGRSALSWSSSVFYLSIAAAMEELLYRGYLITRLQELLKSKEWAMLISFLIFGAIHAFRGWKGFIGSAVFGFVLAITFVRTRSLSPLIAAHALHNLWLEWAVRSF